MAAIRLVYLPMESRLKFPDYGFAVFLANNPFRASRKFNVYRA